MDFYAVLPVRKYWDMHLTGVSKNKSFLLEDKTKVSTNPRLLYHKDDEDYSFKNDLLNSTCSVLIEDSSITCAEIKVEKLLPHCH